MKKALFAAFLTAVFCVSGAAEEGVFKFNVGGIEITALRDKTTNMGAEILSDPNATIVRKLMPDNQNPSSINAFIVRPAPPAESPIVLIDAGYGENLFARMREAGLTPAQIDVVAITHMHPDHIGGLTKNSRALFPNAVVLVPKNDLNYWRGSSEENKNAARALQKAYGDRLTTYGWGDKIAPDITAIRADGHTPGHSAFEIASDGAKLLIVADLIHNAIVQFADPTQTVVFDSDPAAAAATRRKLLNYAANANLTIAGMHIPFPGVGAVKKRENGFVFLPVK